MSVPKAAYQWGDSTLCEDDVVASLTDHEPWSRWRTEEGNEPGDDSTEEELDSIADLFEIDRDDAIDVAQHEFPIRLDHVPDTFCTACLGFFTTKESTS